MDIVKLREQLTVDEGVKLVTYLDHLGLKTVAIGHLCREDDEEVLGIAQSQLGSASATGVRRAP